MKLKPKHAFTASILLVWVAGIFGHLGIGALAASAGFSAVIVFILGTGLTVDDDMLD